MEIRYHLDWLIPRPDGQSDDLGTAALRDAKGTSNVLRDDLKFQGISEYTLFLNIRAKAVITHNPPG